MKTLLCLAALSGLLLAADDDAVKKDMDKLKGTWVLAGGDEGGQDFPQETIKSAHMTFDGDKMSFKIGDIEGEGKIKIDPSKDPKHIDVDMTAGQLEGSRYAGIYTFDGDHLKQCYPEAGGERPTEFTTKSGTGHIYFVW